MRLPGVSSAFVLCHAVEIQISHHFFSHFFQFADQYQQTETVLMLRFDPARSKKSFLGASEQISFLYPRQTFGVPHFICVTSDFTLESHQTPSDKPQYKLVVPQYIYMCEIGAHLMLKK